MSLSPAPKDPRANARYRRELFSRAARDTHLRQECWIRASRDIVWFTDVFAWTFSPKDYPDCPDRPFVLWPFQELAIRQLDAAIGQHDLLIEKSRDMGASWLCGLAFFWRWLFRRRQTFLVVSRKEDLVDKTGDPDSLFWKLDYLYENLPPWMRPSIKRNDLQLVNLQNHSSISGDSTNSDLSRGGRRTAILLDEFAAVDNGHEILSATRDATNCRIFNSTSKGTHTAHYAMKRRMKADNPERLLSMHWSKHPEKSRGLYTTIDGREGSALRVVDANYAYPGFYSFIRDGKLRSPWYDEQCRRAAHPKEIAQELDMDDQESGWTYFDSRELDDLIVRYARRPVAVGELAFDGDGKRVVWSEHEKARLQIWTPLPNEVPPHGVYVVGCDVATGKAGPMSSNSVLSVANRITGEKVAQFTSNAVIPADLARYAIALCRWFCDALLIWEDNGPGGEFGTQVKSIGYRHVFFREDEKKYQKKKTQTPGWWSNKDTKPLLLAQYMQALKAGEFINRCTEALNECREYVREPNGDIVHARSKSTIDPNETGVNHGDMVIADALACRGMADVAAVVADEERDPPINSFAWRQRQSRREKLQTSLY